MSVGSVKREVILEITTSIQDADIHGTTVKFSGSKCGFPISFIFFNSYSYYKRIQAASLLYVGVSNAVLFFPVLLTD